MKSSTPPAISVIRNSSSLDIASSVSTRRERNYQMHVSPIPSAVATTTTFN
ncbi:hypothetical protein Tcan_03486 [Toxocara canis]|uniref:Uncharacterized protein n=1 Tax=Toxocara canis TaxID=6265 RepID=A0A0B2VJS7_TOXCA|nr:hypothetical protein Tcan_03486 [Toxocara canis]